MKVTVDLTWDLGKAAGASSLEIAGAETVALLLDLVRARVGPAFDLHVRFAAIAVNGVLVSRARGLRTRLDDGDVVSFVLASAGG